MLITLGKHRFPNYSMWNRLFDRLTKMDIFGSYSYCYSAGQHTTKFMETTFLPLFLNECYGKLETKEFHERQAEANVHPKPVFGGFGTGKVTVGVAAVTSSRGKVCLRGRMRSSSPAAPSRTGRPWP